MKKICLIIMVFVSINSISQNVTKNNFNNIVGVWQLQSKEVSSGLLDSYKFYLDNKFEFYPSEYNGLKRIIKITGTYKIEDNKIAFNVNSITELVGDKIERGLTTTLSDSWTITDGNLVTRKIKSEKQIATFEFCKTDKSDEDCFLIDGRIYYKIILE